MPRLLTDPEIARKIEDGLAPLPLTGQRVLLIVPDATRTFPLPQLMRHLMRHLRPRARALTVLVALGTHPPLTPAALRGLLGRVDDDPLWAGVTVHNHAWQDPAALAHLGEIPAETIASLSAGLLRQPAPVRLNRLVLEHDHVLICGPVFPHEVAGFSGGNKYFFPGIAGPEVIDLTHWLGALLTSAAIIGTPHTPVRAVIDAAARLIPTPRHALCGVVTPAGELAGLFVDTPEAAWAAALPLSAELHVHWLDRPVRRVLAVLPPMYDELWVGGKGMYKTEPVVAEGGEVIIYAPHLHTISRVHGALIREVGYHVRDYFLQQWARFQHVPLAVLAHSTHVRGAGVFEAGVERARVQVTLATGLSAAECRAINLGYCDPAAIDPAAWAAREEPDLLVLPRAGEHLYRLRA